MRHIWKNLLILLLVSTVLSWSPGAPLNENYHVSFGVKIGILPTGGLTQFAIFHYRNGRYTAMQPLQIHELIKIGTGDWPIPRTRTFRNFFEENGLKSSKGTADMDTVQPFNLSAAIDSLWKIRFPEHPFDPKLGYGWSNGEARPSLAQQAYIYNTYGVRGYDQDYFSDTSFFKLLRDVMDLEWIENYKSLH